MCHQFDVDFIFDLQLKLEEVADLCDNVNKKVSLLPRS